MEKIEVKNRIQEVFRDVLDNDDILLENDMTAEDIDGYDSLTHIQLVVAIEKEFKTKFSSKEMMTWSTIGEMIDCVFVKVN